MRKVTITVLGIVCLLLVGALVFNARLAVDDESSHATVEGRAEEAAALLAEEMERLQRPSSKVRLSTGAVDSSTGLPKGVTERRVLITGADRRAEDFARVIETAKLDDEQRQLLFQVLEDARLEAEGLIEDLTPHSSPDSPLFWRIDEIQTSFLVATDQQIRDRASTFLSPQQMEIFRAFPMPGAFAATSRKYLASASSASARVAPL